MELYGQIWLWYTHHLLCWKASLAMFSVKYSMFSLSREKHNSCKIRDGFFQIFFFILNNDKKSPEVLVWPWISVVYRNIYLLAYFSILMASKEPEYYILEQICTCTVIASFLILCIFSTDLLLVLPERIVVTQPVREHFHITICEHLW